MLFFALGSIALLIAAIALVTHYSPVPEAQQPRGISDSGWLDSFSLASYRPMIRLASGEDAKYLEAQLGRAAARAYLGVQRALLRDYLRRVSRDFNRLHRIALDKAVRASTDQGNLSMTLVEQQFGFIFLIWTLEAKLLLHSVLPFGVDLKPLFEFVDGIALQTRELSRSQLSIHVH